MPFEGDRRVNRCDITSGYHANNRIHTRCTSCKHPTRPKYFAAFSLGKDDTFIGHLPGLSAKTSTGWVEFAIGHRDRSYSAVTVFHGWVAHCWPDEPVDQTRFDAALLMVALGGDPFDAVLTYDPHST